MTDLNTLITWGTLRLVSGLISAGFDTLMLGAGNGLSGEETPKLTLFKWSGDLVFKARKKSSPPAALTAGSAQLAPEAANQLGYDMANLTAQVGGMRDNVESLREAIVANHEENMVFLSDFNEKLLLTQHRLQGMQLSSVRSAQIALDDYNASEGDISFLEAARSSAMSALAQGQTLDLDARFIAGTIAVAAGYVRMSKMKSPEKAKMFTINGTVKAIIQNLAPIWTEPASERMPHGQKTLQYLLDMLSCACLLPPEEVLVLPNVDERLLPILGRLCSAQPALRARYPEISDEVVRMSLGGKRILDLCILARNVDTDIGDCETKTEIIDALICSGNVILEDCDQRMPDDTAGQGAVEVLHRSFPVPDVMADQAGPLVLRNRPSGPDPADWEGISALENSPGGPSRWKESWNWGTSEPLETWHGVTTGGSGRVVRLDLSNNFIKGQIPTALGRMSALMHLKLSANGLTGPIPPALGDLVALVILDLSMNSLTGGIPSELGKLTALEALSLGNNKLKGHIPPELGNLKALRVLLLGRNKLNGPFVRELFNLTGLEKLGLNHIGLCEAIPSELGKLTGLRTLDLSGNSISGVIPPEMGQLTALEVLSLHGNQLGGSIPIELHRLTSLRYLALSMNRFKGCKLVKATWFPNCPDIYIGFSTDVPPVFSDGVKFK